MSLSYTNFNDFGFTVVNENELEAVQNATAVVEQAAAAELTAAEMKAALELERNKVITIMEAIMPLLSNLSANPERDYIYWPGLKRTEVIASFKENLIQIQNQSE